MIDYVIGASRNKFSIDDYSENSPYLSEMMQWLHGEHIAYTMKHVRYYNGWMCVLEMSDIDAVMLKMFYTYVITVEEFVANGYEFTRRGHIDPPGYDI